MGDFQEALWKSVKVFLLENDMLHKSEEKSRQKWPKGSTAEKLAAPQCWGECCRFAWQSWSAWQSRVETLEWLEWWWACCPPALLLTPPAFPRTGKEGPEVQFSFYICFSRSAPVHFCLWKWSEKDFRLHRAVCAQYVGWMENQSVPFSPLVIRSFSPLCNSVITSENGNAHWATSTPQPWPQMTWTYCIWPEGSLYLIVSHV